MSKSNEKFSINTSAEIKKGISKVAIMRRTTVSTLVNDLLYEYLKEHTEEIKKYDEVFSSKKEVAL